MTLDARTVAARLADPRSPEQGVVSTLAVAALTLVEPRNLGLGARIAYRTATSALATWTVWASLRDDALPLPPATRTGLALATAGVTMGLADASEALDARLIDRMRRAGVRRPRVALAAASVVLGAASWWLSRGAASVDHAAVDDDALPEDEPVDVPEHVRNLVAALLHSTPHFGATELLAQLDEARAIVFEGPFGPDAFWPGIGFQVPESAPRAVPGNANFPVIGRFRALDDRTFDVYLSIQDGRLSTLSISEGADWSTADQIAWLEAGRGVEELSDWPELSELTLQVETSSGYSPID
ncbi:hypothetical protein [Salinibacterium sp. ZJ70]|uniref:hypothetical protein n=1 Tax=Salinibacterium sp. ZJ70 TaxID=2708084 RepID=UPI00141E7B27|nr:hypothetical protein [Salinibacterium sp. ZJ70]